MPTLYVDHHGAKLSVDSGSLVVTYPERSAKEKLSLPCAQVDRVVILGEVHFTGAAIRTLLARDIPTVFAGSGQWHGLLDRHRAEHPGRRAAQYAWLKDENAALETARALIAAKVVNQHHVLRGWKLPHVGGASQTLAAVAQAPCRENLRGVEGARARSYFAGLGEHLGHHGWNFPGRHHHPAPDPVNALLSFGYTLMTQEMALAVSAHGLDGNVGPLHSADGRQPALVLDLIEPFRPLVDRLVAQTLVHQLRPDDFVPSEAGVRLAPKARSGFIRAWEDWLADEMTWQGKNHERRHLIHMQVETLCRHLDGGEAPRFYHLGDH